MCPHTVPNNNYITEDLFRKFGASQALDPWRPQVCMTLTWKHSAFKPPGTNNCLDVLKKEWQIKIALEKGFKLHAQP